MRAISSFIAKQNHTVVKDLVISLGETIEDAIPSTEMPRFSKQFWDETKEACEEVKAHEKEMGVKAKTLSLAQLKALSNKIKGIEK